jgi:hypothetical protein
MPDPKKADWFSQFEDPKDDYFSQFEEIPSSVTDKPKSLFDKAWDVGKAIVGEGQIEAQEFAAKHPTISGIGRRFLFGPNKEDLGGIEPPEALTMSPGKIPGLEKGADYLKNKMINSGDYVTGFTGELLKEWMPGIIEGAFDPSNAGTLRGIPKKLPREFMEDRLASVLKESPKPEPTVSPVNIVKNERRLLGPGKRYVNPEGVISNAIEGVQLHEPTNAEGFVTVKDDTKLEPQIKTAEVVSEVPGLSDVPDLKGQTIMTGERVRQTLGVEPKEAIANGWVIPEEELGTKGYRLIQNRPDLQPTVQVKGTVQEYIDAVKSGKIERSVSYSEFLKNKETLLSRFVKEELGEFTPFKMFKKIRGVDPNEANKIRETIIDTLIQGGKLDLEGIYGKSIGVNRNQFNKIVDEIIDTGAASKIANEIKVNTPEPIQRLLGVLKENKINRAVQDTMVSQEKAQRFAAFSNTLKKGQGKEGFFKAASKMSGEYSKVSANELELGASDVQELFDQIKNNTKITPAEQLRAGFALRDLLEGTRTLQPNELMLMDRIYGPGIGNQIIQMHGGIGGVGIKLAKTANTMKSMQATLDLSAPFRQGLGLVHRKEFWNAYAQMFKYAGSEESFQALGRSIEEHSNYLLSRDAGLFTADHSLGNFEEAFMDSYLNDVHSAMGSKAKYSPARISERAYVGFLNKLRFDTFNTLIQKAEKAGLETYKIVEGERTATDLIKQIAKYINTSTGRGDLGKFAKYAEDMNTVLFSPRLIASRLQILNPKYYIDSPAFVRKEALKTLFAMAGFTVIASEIGALLNGQTKLTPTQKNLTNPDYGKIKWGNVRLDPGGGMNQYIVAASQFITGKATSSTSGNSYDLGQFGQPGRVGKLVGLGNPRANSFLENKFSPMASLINTIISGKIDPATRKPYNIPTELRKRVTPLLAQDLMDLYKEDPNLMGLGIPASMGMALQTYDEPAPSMSLGSGLGVGNLKP